MKKNTAQKIAAVAVPSALFLAAFSPAFALDVSTDTSVNVNTGATGTSITTEGSGTGYDLGRPTKRPLVETKTAARISATQAAANAKAGKQIQARVSDLAALQARLAQMKHLSPATKTALESTINANVTSLTDLKTKIAADTTAADLKADTAFITKGERIYALVNPQVKIIAAADSANTVIDMITAMSAKIDVRVTAATTAGRDMTAVVKLQADLAAKLADAKTQSAAATALVSGLMPDNGDKTVLASNNAALKSARADIELATKDLKAAQKDVDMILKALVKAPKAGVDIKKELSPSTTTSTTVTQ